MTIDEHKEINKDYIYKKMESEWDGYVVYQSAHKDSVGLPPGTMLYDGGPHFVLEKDGKARRATLEEDRQLTRIFSANLL